MGNTSDSAQKHTRNAVHPHTRGEHGRSSQIPGRRTGSSPHPWGTPNKLECFWPLCRFIPTPVGNTNPGLPETGINAVHPHTRGEHLLVAPHSAFARGSSPHPWGTRILPYSLPFLARFIPTPVGNTISSGIPTMTLTVHPHTRGEHRMARCKVSSRPGSSPHPWGTLCHRFYFRPVYRFIPTPVGNTRSIITVRSGFSVHPHTRGEH